HDPRDEQQQLRVLQQPDRQRKDRRRERALRASAGQGLGAARHLHDEELRAVGADRQPEPARLRRTEDRRIHVPAGVRSPRPRCALPEVGPPTKPPVEAVGRRDAAPHPTSTVRKGEATAMIRYLVRRVIWAAALFLAVTLIGFVLFYLIPADPARFACGRSCTPQMIRKVAHYLGTDRPVYVRYATFIGRLAPISLSGGLHLKSPDLGRSFVNRQSVNTIVAQAAPETASLVIALPVGILSALRPRSLLDRVSMAGVLAGISAHPVWIGLTFAYVVGYRLHLTPIAGYANFFHPLYAQPGGPAQWAYHLLLPWFTLAILYAALYVRMIRANGRETMNEDFVRTARAKGASEARV